MVERGGGWDATNWTNKQSVTRNRRRRYWPHRDGSSAHEPETCSRRNGDEPPSIIDDSGLLSSAPVLEESSSRRKTTSAEVRPSEENCPRIRIFTMQSDDRDEKAFSSYVALAASRGLVTLVELAEKNG